MRAVVQRVNEGSVEIDGMLYSKIGRGFVILLGIRKGDPREYALSLAERCSSLRLFPDVGGKMNLGLKEVNGSVLIVSQFTLYGDVRKGNRPGFSDAAPASEAEPLYEMFVDRMKTILGSERVFTGVFRAMMNVTIVNDGPVTLLLEEG